VCACMVCKRACVPVCVRVCGPRGVTAPPPRHKRCLGEHPFEASHILHLAIRSPLAGFSPFERRHALPPLRPHAIRPAYVTGRPGPLLPIRALSTPEDQRRGAGVDLPGGPRKTLPSPMDPDLDSHVRGRREGRGGEFDPRHVPEGPSEGPCPHIPHPWTRTPAAPASAPGSSTPSPFGGVNPPEIRSPFSCPALRSPLRHVSPPP